jgi:acyl-CoA synthetase (NDP forming)
VAVVGASARPGSVGGAILRHVLAAGFTGDVHAIGTRGGQLEGLVLHRSVRDVPGDLDLAVVAVPADAVLDVARDCAAEGVRALVVVSAGFAEAGARGRERQRELMRICRAAGMRLVGPNCLGVMNTDPAVGLNASLGPVQAPPGRVAFMSQSGALGIAVIGAAKERGLGLSSFVSVGNKADLSSTDFLAFWDRDEGTDVILLYLESFGNPRRFSRVARGVAARKPIVVVKGGRASGGARAGCSHTRALLAASDATVDALFAQSGVVRTDTLGELLDVAGLLAAQAPPAGPRVGIVTNGSGLGILCADACQAGVERGAHADLRPARVARGPTRRSRRRQPARPARGGLARAVRARNRRCRRQRRGGRNRRPLRAVARHGHRGGCGRRTRCRRRCTDPRGRRLRAGGGAPGHPGAALLPLPEDAARALGRAARYGAWRAAPTGRVPALEVDDAAAAAIIARALGRGPGWFATEEAAALLHCYGIAQPRDELVADADAAGATAHRWRRPIALKGVADGLVHRSDARAVAHGLSGARTPLNPRCGPPDEPVIGGGAHAPAARTAACNPR